VIALLGVACSSGDDATSATSAVTTPASVTIPATTGTSLPVVVSTTEVAAAATTPTAAPVTTIAPDASDVATSAPQSSAPLAPATTAVNVYAGAGVGDESPAVSSAKAYVYVPSNSGGAVTVIDQETMAIVSEFSTGRLTQHVVPGWDLQTLYATASGTNRLVPIDPATGEPGEPIPVDAPYNLYFSPDGVAAIVMAERLNRIDFYDRSTWKRFASLPTGACEGVNHADWSADTSFFVATCEFSGQVLKVDSATGTVLGLLALPDGAMPQDLRLAPDGSKFYVADMYAGGVWVLDAAGSAVVGFVETGVGAHGIYPSRDASLLYVTNRGRNSNKINRPSQDGEGSVSVIDPTTDTVTATWTIPGGGSPDMGGVSADGTTFWVSGRHDSVVYAFDTTTGELRAKIDVPPGPHGLCVFPQPGAYSLGHTGNYR